METLEAACRVYVGNLLPKVKEVDLTSKFTRYGTIHSVWIARKPPGFAFVGFATPDEAQRAVNASGNGEMKILGKTVRVQMAGDKEKERKSRGSEREREVDVDREKWTRSYRERTEDSSGCNDGRDRCRRSRSGGRRSENGGRLRNSCRESSRRSRSRLRTRSSSRSRVRGGRSRSRSRSRR
ncbi:unnamed protein product [Peronospora effusa]|uniref:RRM domain-containing protein n=1 Tax=Peronospora effusa TaxID=542832 RepID=A0A3M6VJP1_9STRA|nr:hypothetical protein DD238_001617 [Peronospora effusa]RQM12423.1 hypothetical protein DD237_000949 [Peronospora effusa]CAI5700838.1 unnamed protein product [Peronospora effusa]